MEKTLGLAALGFLLPLAVFEAVGLGLWGMQQAVNGAISLTPYAKAYDLCIHSHLDELLQATTTTSANKVLALCPQRPYL